MLLDRYFITHLLFLYTVNFWFHPPDGDSFEHPYSTEFWPNDFRDRFLEKER